MAGKDRPGQVSGGGEEEDREAKRKSHSQKGGVQTSWVPRDCINRSSVRERAESCWVRWAGQKSCAGRCSTPLRGYRGAPPPLSTPTPANHLQGRVGPHAAADLCPIAPHSR